MEEKRLEDDPPGKSHRAECYCIVCEEEEETVCVRRMRISRSK